MNSMEEDDHNLQGQWGGVAVGGYEATSSNVGSQ